MQKIEQPHSKLKRIQYDILVCLESNRNSKRLSQRMIAKNINRSTGLVNSAIQELNKLGYIEHGVISTAGIHALEPYKVKRAIFLAAGLGERLIPITLNTPKPLVRVMGTRMIDTVLDALVSIGIEEIYIVRGYLSEQFDQLLYKYPNIQFVENPIYMESNTISSLMCVRYHLQNCYVFDADLYLVNRNLITKYQYTSNYVGIPTDASDDWVCESKGGIITKMKKGGYNCHLMIGISYWSGDYGVRLAEHVNQVYSRPGGRELYWDQVAIDFYKDIYQIEIRECCQGDVVEIDTYSELKQYDKAYNG